MIESREGAVGQVKRELVRASPELAPDLARFREPLRRYFLRRVRDPEEAEDLTHDLLVRVLNSAAGRPTPFAEALIFASAANLLKDRARRARVAARAQDTLETLRQDPVEGFSPERVLSYRQTLSQTLALLDRLEPRVREVFVLHRLEGLKYAEIAEIYGVSVSSIEKYMSKALAKIARHAQRARD